MLKNISRLEHKVGDRVYHLICDNDSPLNDVKDALCKFLSYVDQIAEAAKANQAAQQEAQPVPEGEQNVDQQ